MAKNKRYSTGNSFSQFEGFDEVASLFASLADRAPDAYEDKLGEVARKIEADAKRNVHHVQHNIDRSISLKKLSSGNRVTYKILAGGVEAPHAHLVEFGHRMVTSTGEVVGDVPAHPFLRKAFNDNKSEIVSSLNEALDDILKGV